jgi:hypothetical protein
MQPLLLDSKVVTANKTAFFVFSVLQYRELLFS